MYLVPAVTISDVIQALEDFCSERKKQEKPSSIEIVYEENGEEKRKKGLKFNSKDKLEIDISLISYHQEDDDE